MLVEGDWFPIPMNDRFWELKLNQQESSGDLMDQGKRIFVDVEEIGEIFDYYLGINGWDQ